MKKMINKALNLSENLKLKLSKVAKDNKGSITIEGLIFIVIMVGLVVLVFKPQITTTMNTIMGIWSTDVTTMFNNAQ